MKVAFTIKSARGRVLISREDYINKKIIIINSVDGDKLSFKNDNILIKDENDTTKMQYTCYRVLAIFVIGPFSLTSGLAERLRKYKISIIFFKYSFRPYLTILNGVEGNTELRHIQYAFEDSLLVAQKIVENKIQNQIRTIKKKRDLNDRSTLDLLNDYSAKIPSCQNLQEIMGYEGNASRIYFKAIFDQVDWHGRTPRVKMDITNFLLDVGYTLLFSLIESTAVLFGFDLYIGNLHQEFYQRKSLICDLIEPFRPIVDYTIRKMHNLGAIKMEDFEMYNGMYRLKHNASKNYQFLILNEIIQYREEIYLYIRKYYLWIKDVRSRPYLEFKIK